MKKLLSVLAAAAIVGSCLAAPVRAADIDTYVRMNDDVTFEMTDAEYWIDKYYESTGTEEKKARSLSQLKQFNADNELTLSTENYTINIYDLDYEMDGDIVREIIGDIDVPSDPSKYYRNGKPTTRSYWENISETVSDERASIPDTVDVRFGYSIARSSLRMAPTNDFIGEDSTDRFYDVLVMSEFLPYQPLVVVHESADGEWYYVLFDRFGGWINKKYVAICPDKEDWLKRREPKEFLVVTGREIRLQADQRNPQLSNQLIPMGTKLPLVRASKYPEFLNDRETTNCYVVKLPVRDSEGMITDKYSLISIKEDVNIGYLEYTRGNIVRQAFKLLGDRYGWAGLDNSNDCSGITGQIYRCFGAELPRTSSQIGNLNTKNSYDVSSSSDSEKTALMEKLPIGSILFFKGHIMIYIGMEDGDPYCISATGTYYDDGMDINDTNSVIITNMARTYRSDGSTWLSHLQKIVVI